MNASQLCIADVDVAALRVGKGSDSELLQSDSIAVVPEGETRAGTRQYARSVHNWVAAIGLDPTACGTHSMRRTKPTLIHRRTKDFQAVQLLLGHTKLESTVCYLRIEVDDALEIPEQTEV